MPTVVATYQPGCIDVDAGPLRNRMDFAVWLDERLGMDDDDVWFALKQIKPDSVLLCQCTGSKHGQHIAKVWQREFGDQQKEMFG